jgi:hypothetical protein
MAAYKLAIDSRDHAPASASSALVVHYLDHWNFDLIWLPVIYLSSHNIRIIDGKKLGGIGNSAFQRFDEYFPTLTDGGGEPLHATRPAEPAASSRHKLKTGKSRRDGLAA